MSFFPTTETFSYSFTDTNGNIFNLDMIATNSISNINVYTISSISGTAELFGSGSSSAITSLSNYYGGDNLLGVVGAGPSYSPTTFWSSNGVSFATADGNYWNLAFSDPNSVTYYNIDPSYNFMSAAYADTGSAPTVTPGCYMPGTFILTSHGDVLVEDLKVGDLLPTLSGKNIPIQWIGKQKLQGAFLPKDKSPVCISAGSLGDGLPVRDLFVSAGHSMKIGDHLVDARLLVNGITITQYQRFEQFEYYHIDLGEHHCILAEGVWSESYLECNDNRKNFYNVAEFYKTYPDHLKRTSPEKCLPHISDYQDPRHAALFQTLLAYIPEDRATTDPDLHLLADGKRLEPYEFVPRAFVFRVPAGTQDLRLMSRTSRPCELGLPADDRQLGFCIQSLTALSDDGAVKIMIDPHHAKLLEGFHQAEGFQRRWTQGNAALPMMLLGDGTEEMILTVKGSALPRYHISNDEHLEFKLKMAPFDPAK
jgi:hypothetical protein